MTDPWFKFFPADWRQDPMLRMCSLGARGLWIELIALMHQATPYGHLLVSGASPTDMQLAVLVGCPSDMIPQLMAELESAGVFSRTRTGIIYSRKMTRMQKKIANARNNGRKGGNPNLRKQTEIPASDNPEDNQPLILRSQKPESEREERKKEKKDSLSDRRSDKKAISGEIEVCVQVFNEAAESVGWPKVQKLTPARTSAIKSRLAECGGIEGWRVAIGKASASRFLTTPTEKWAGPTFDWITAPSNFTKIMEGNYDNRDKPARQSASGGPENRPDPALENIFRLAGFGKTSGDGSD